MYRSHSSISYEILHGIHMPMNVSAMLAYLSYFPPPPPVLPGPPPRRFWTCSSHSSASLSCFVSDDRNPSSLRQYISLNNYTQSKLLKNKSDILDDSPSSPPNKLSSLSNYLTDLYHRNQLSFIILSIILLILLLIVIFSLISFLYFNRCRRRSVRSNNKNQKFYYNLLPLRRKHSANVDNNEQKLVRLRKNSSSAQTMRIEQTPTKNNYETEEAV